MMNFRGLHGPSYYPGYLSMDDILATNEKLPCKFERTVVGLGFLDSSSQSKDLEKGAQLELPFWLASALGPRRNIVSSQLPRVFNERYREILRADAKLVDLHSLSPYFYEFGRHLLPLMKRDANALGKLLVDTLKNRLRGVMDASLNCLDDEATGYKANLDQLERYLFHTGRKTFHDHQLWLARRSHIINANANAHLYGKRKLSEIS